MILRFGPARRLVLLGELSAILPAWGVYPVLTGAFACLIGGAILPFRGYPVRLGVLPVGLWPGTLMAAIDVNLRCPWLSLRLVDSVNSPSPERRILSCPFGGDEGKSILS